MLDSVKNTLSILILLYSVQAKIFPLKSNIFFEGEPIDTMLLSFFQSLLLIMHAANELEITDLHSLILYTSVDPIV